MKYKKYNKKFDYSYVFGVTPVIDVIKYKKGVIEKVILSTKIDTKLADNIIDLCKKNNVTFEFNSSVIDKLSFKENTYAVAVINKYNSKVDNNKNHLLLVNPSNMGNLGTIIRSCVAFDVSNIVIIKPACDIFDPKVISSSMGAFFMINIEYFESVDQYLNKHNNKIYAFTLNGGTKLNDLLPLTPYTLAFGNEGEGLPEYFNKFETVKIAVSESIDSLNLSVAVGIALHCCKSS